MKARALLIITLAGLLNSCADLAGLSLVVDQDGATSISIPAPAATK